MEECLGDTSQPEQANGRLRSLNPAAMFTARLQAAMMRLATITTSVMSWIMERRRVVDGSKGVDRDATPLEREDLFQCGAGAFNRARGPIGRDDHRGDGKPHDFS